MNPNSNFRQKVYNEVRKIARGETRTYAQIALAIGRPGAARAVGNALNKNHDPGVPCHRVIRADGRPGGYNKGGDLKAAILRKEGAIK